VKGLRYQAAAQAVKRFAAALPKDAERRRLDAASTVRIINYLDATPLSSITSADGGICADVADSGAGHRRCAIKGVGSISWREAAYLSARLAMTQAADLLDRRTRRAQK
jgi:hypothetical protein